MNKKILFIQPSIYDDWGRVVKKKKLYFVGLAALGYLFWRGTAPAAAVYALAYFGMSYLSSWLISGGRYLFGCLGLYLALGSVRRPWVRGLLLAAEGGLLLLYAVYYMQGQAIM